MRRYAEKAKTVEEAKVFPGPSTVDGNADSFGESGVENASEVCEIKEQYREIRARIAR